MKAVSSLSQSQMISISINRQLTHVYQVEYITVEIPGINRGGAMCAIPQWESVFYTKKIIRFLYDYQKQPT